MSEIAKWFRGECTFTIDLVQVAIWAAVLFGLMVRLWY